MAPAGSRDAGQAGKAGDRATSTQSSPLPVDRSIPGANIKLFKATENSRKPAISGAMSEEPSSTEIGVSVFDTFGDTADADDNKPEHLRVSVDMDELPIELIGLTDRYVLMRAAQDHFCNRLLRARY